MHNSPLHTHKHESAHINDEIGGVVMNLRGGEFDTFTYRGEWHGTGAGVASG
jgi:hypothetical protein